MTIRHSAAALCATLLCVAASPAFAQDQDLRTPDTQNVTTRTSTVMPWQDLRTPDAQDAAFDATHPDHA